MKGYQGRGSRGLGGSGFEFKGLGVYGFWDLGFYDEKYSLTLLPHMPWSGLHSSVGTALMRRSR